MPKIRAKELNTYHIVVDGRRIGKVCEVNDDGRTVTVRVKRYQNREGYFHIYKFKRNQLVEVKRRNTPAPLKVERAVPVVAPRRKARRVKPKIIRGRRRR